MMRGPKHGADLHLSVLRRVNSYMDSGAASALNAFIENGSCTEGWTIYVDGVKYC
jgi:hypothetical protein